MSNFKWLVGFRKFTVVIIFLCVSLGLLLAELMTGSEWVQYNSQVVIAFMATNVGERLLNLGKDYFRDKMIDKVLKK